mmetsp:Transcript_9721/g.24162  ORF Transcript_9721/g.24162 Transcript_9721/m.24162 type:complete len:219 (-) Transcript_9721:1442-2098(-)
MLGMASRRRSRRRQGHSCRKRSATSNVAPPHISSEPAFCRMCEVAGATLSMSMVRMRVASRDWCASRMVVSVSSTPLCARTALAQPSAPSRSYTLRHPILEGPAASMRGGTGCTLAGGGPVAPGWSGPLTTISARYMSSLEERSEPWPSKLNRSRAFFSMKLVLHSPSRNSGWRSTFSRNEMLVLMPRIWNSLSARCIFCAACGKVGALAMTLASIES